MITVKRVYDKVEKRDGFRILVDRVWPRGLTKENVKMDLWLKEIAPTKELRQWFEHDPKKWSEFKKRYFEELKKNKATSEIVDHAKRNNITLLYSAKDEKFNQAVALKEFIETYGEDY